MVSIVKVDREGEELNASLELFKEYLSELNENLSFQNFDAELRDPLKKYGPPLGALFLAYYDGEPAGCIALQSISNMDESIRVCEMKRLYVKPAYRRNKIADELVKVLLKEAQLNGYHTMVLDTLVRLQPAIRLYQRHGFQNTKAYYSNPLPGVVYMERALV